MAVTFLEALRLPAADETAWRGPLALTIRSAVGAREALAPARGAGLAI